MSTSLTYGQALVHAARGRSLPAAEARLLLQHVTGSTAAQVIAHPGRPLGPVDRLRFESLVERRARGEPIAYLVGWREFFGRRFGVGPDVLIPRPETEGLVEAALARLPAGEPRSVLDLGTGSGCVAITIALERPGVEVVAVDASGDALAVARRNAAMLDGRVEFVESDWLSALAGRRFDIIVANPPYIAAGDPHLGQGDLRFEPRHALTPGEDGLAALVAIVAQSTRALGPGGWLLLEHGHDQSAAVRAALEFHRYRDVFSDRDLAGIERISGGRRAPRRRARSAD